MKIENKKKDMIIELKINYSVEQGYAITMYRLGEEFSSLRFGNNGRVNKIDKKDLLKVLGEKEEGLVIFFDSFLDVFDLKGSMEYLSGVTVVCEFNDKLVPSCVSCVGDGGKVYECTDSSNGYMINRFIIDTLSNSSLWLD